MAYRTLDHANGDIVPTPINNVTEVFDALEAGLYPPDDTIRSCDLIIEADGYFRLRYRIGTGHMVASLGTFHESIVRDDFESTRASETGMAVLAAIDHRSKRDRRPIAWYVAL